MLESLHIENIAVIERADVDFHDALNVLTGETGAGKSILIDAINAVLGERVRRDLVRTGCDEACVYATFSAVSPRVKEYLATAGYPMEEDTLLIGRTIRADGRSGCIVPNPVNGDVRNFVCKVMKLKQKALNGADGRFLIVDLVHAFSL